MRLVCPHHGSLLPSTVLNMLVLVNIIHIHMHGCIPTISAKPPTSLLVLPLQDCSTYWLVPVCTWFGYELQIILRDIIFHTSHICRATTRPPRPSSTAECLRLIAHLRGEQASAASWEPRPPFEATEMD